LSDQNHLQSNSTGSIKFRPRTHEKHLAQADYLDFESIIYFTSSNQTIQAKHPRGKMHDLYYVYLTSKTKKRTKASERILQM